MPDFFLLEDGDRLLLESGSALDLESSIAVPVPKLEAAFGADITADPNTWTWTDLTARTQRNEVTITRGKPDGGQSQAQPGHMALVLDNGDGALTPGLATSTYYPHVKRGLPVRHSVHFSAPYLACSPGNSAGTPEAPSLDITGDTYWGFEFLAPFRLPQLPGREMGSKFQFAGQFSWEIETLESSGAIVLRWSADGSASFSATSTAGIPCPDSGVHSLAIHLDVNNGSGGNTVRFWAAKGTLAELESQLAVDETVVRLGDPVTAGGTTSVFVSTSRVLIGSHSMNVRRFRLRSGDWTGTIVADPDFTSQVVGATSFADGAAVAKTWTLNGAAEITDRRVRFLGQLAGNVPKWPGNGVPGTATVDWDVQGVLRRLRTGAKLLNSPLTRLVTSRVNAGVGAVDAYWPMEDGTLSTRFSSGLVGGPAMFANGDALAFASDSSFPGATALPKWSSGSGSWTGVVPAPAVAPTTANWSVDMFFRIDTPVANPAVTHLISVTNTGTSQEWLVAINDTEWQLTATSTTGFTPTTVVSNITGVIPAFFGGWVLLHLREVQSGGNVAWEFSLVPESTGGNSQVTGTFAGTVGRIARLHNGFAVPSGGVSFGHAIASHDRTLGWLAPADTAYIGEPATSRIFRLCYEEQVPLTLDGLYTGTDGWNTRAPVIDVGLTPMGGQEAKSLLDLLQECADVDGGILADSQALLGLTYRAGRSLQNQAPALSLTSEVVNPLEPTDDDKGLVNSATVTRTNGGSGMFEDVTSIAELGLYDDSVTLNVWSDDQTEDHASWRVHEATWPEMRVPVLTAELAKNTSSEADWVDAAIGDVVEATALPVEYPDRSLSQLIDGYAETISPFLWTLAMNVRPSGPWNVGIVDDASATPALARADTDGCTLGATINTSATTVLLASSGARFTTDPTHFPFDILVDGEQMTVTAIAGASVAHGSDGAAAHADFAPVTPGLPASTAQGDLLLMLAAIRRHDGTVITPAGWTRLVDMADAGTTAIANAAVFAQVAPASPAAPTVSFTGVGAGDTTSAQITRFTGRWTSEANSLIVAHHLVNASDQNIAYPNLVPRYDHGLIVLAGWKQDDWTSVAAPGGFTQIGAPSSVLGNDQGIVWDYQIQTSAATIQAGAHAVTGGTAVLNSSAMLAIVEDTQSVTVTRAVNGVTKAHTAGAVVTLVNPFRPSLN
jgi:hypothetical protein